MQYPAEALQKLREGIETIPAQIQQLQIACLVSCEDIANPLVKEYMNHGVGRRLGVLRHAVLKVFDLFPPATVEKLDRETLFDVQINLQAFFINLIGVFDNFAWSFVHLHNAEREVGGRLNVDMFKNRMQSILPAALRQHLLSESMASWHSQYLKNYRDALAHRIPLYIPPSNITAEEQGRYNVLQERRLPLIMARQWDEFDALNAEQESLGTPCFAFLHSFNEDNAPRPILLHPQMLSDASTVIEFGNLFLTHWRGRA